MKKERKISASKMMGVMLELSKSIQTATKMLPNDSRNPPFEVLIDEVENNSIDIMVLLPPCNNETQNCISRKRLKSLYNKLKVGAGVYCCVNGIDSISKVTAYAKTLGFQTSCSIKDNLLILEKKGNNKRLIKKNERKHILILNHPFVILCVE